ncbi:MAG: SurA N-terminal domain-containing protein [Bacteroidales bacterium]|nr:SurA N-terminal domain-containing protein [Bacteroidales bacterium]
MAALEKIRKRSVFLMIVVGGALAAFVLGDLFKLDSLFRDSAAAKVDNTTIGIQEFQQRFNFAQELEKNQQNKSESAELQQQVLGQMAFETIIEAESEDNGVEAGTELLTAMINQDRRAGAWAQQYVQATGQQTIQAPSDLDKIVGKDEVINQIVTKEQWENFKSEMETNIRAQKIMMLVGGAIVANDLDLLEMQNNDEVMTVELAKKDYTSLEDKKYEPTNDEIKAVYEQYKNIWKLNEKSVLAHVIAVPIAPSAADIKAADNLYAKAYAELQGKGLDALRNINEFSNVQEMKLTDALAKQMGEQMRDSAFSSWATSAAANATHQFKEGENYAIFQKVKSEELLDTIKVLQVTVQGDKKAQDKVLAALNAGQDVSKMKGVEVMPEQPVPVQGAQLPDSIIAKFEGATDKYVVFQAAKEGAMLVKTTYQKKSMFHTVNMATYTVTASKKTTANLHDGLEKFIEKNNTAENFAKNAAAAKFQAQEVMLGSSVPTIGGISGSRDVIKWALNDAEKGQVSTVFQLNSAMVALAVDDIVDGDYLPLENKQVNDFCKAKAMAQKKAQAMKEQYEGKFKSVAEAAKAFNTQVDTTSFSFSSMFADKIVMTSPAGIEGDGGFIGAAAAAKPGQVGFWAGNCAAYAYVVKTKKASEIKMKQEELAQKWNSTFGFGGQRQQMLQGVIFNSAKVKNNLVKFQ